MGQRKEIVRYFVSQGLKIISAVDIAGIKKSTYYYHSNGKPRGKGPSKHTRKATGCVVTNEAVLTDIFNLISPEYHDYGYQTVTHLLRRMGYIINPKKVYRLMKVNNLLHPKITKGNKQDKNYIKYTVPPLERPFVTIEADIKYVYIHGEKRNAYLITFLCTFCRFAVVWKLDYRMRAKEIVKLLNDLMSHPVVKENVAKENIKVKVRTDNGPQFIAKILAETLKQLGIIHEFINPGTPQENGHIESFHSTVSRLVCNKNIFGNLEHARNIFREFYSTYNNTRSMKSLLYYSPIKFIELWNTGCVAIKKDKKKREIFYFREMPQINIVEDISSEDLFVLNKSNTFDHSIINLQEISPI